MKAVVKKWGNSASVRIPSAVLQAAKLRLEDSVDVREESGRIVIEPVPRTEYDLSELLKRITPEPIPISLPIYGLTERGGGGAINKRKSP